MKKTINTSSPQRSWSSIIKILDVLVIIIIVGLVVGLLAFYSHSKEEVVIELDAKPLAVNSNGAVPPYYWYSNDFATGDKGYDEFGQLVAEVLKVENVDFGGPHRYLRLTVKVNALKENKTNLFKLGYQRLRIGDDLTLTIKDKKFTGTIMTINGSQEKEATEQELKEVSVRLLVRNAYKWLVPIYSSGFKATDQNNQTIFEVTDIIAVSESEPRIYLERNELVTRSGELFRDVELIAKIKVNCQSEVCYFNRNQPVKIGEQLWVQSAQSTLSNAVIIEILSGSQP